MEFTELIELSKRIRQRSLEIAYNSGKNGSHLGGGLSMVEIFSTLYGGIVDINKIKETEDDRDRVIVSKGHCVLSYYSILEHCGLLTKETVDNFETNGALLHGHAIRNLAMGIEFSGGSLSLGISYAVGVAIASKRKGLNNRVFTIVGDGECDEGLVWEAAMSAANFKLDNLTVIVDANKLQYDGFTIDVMNHSSLSDKFKSFGFYTLEIDGHNCEDIYFALQQKTDGSPIAIIANTIKGKGVSFMENNRDWHHAELKEELYKQAQIEIKNR